MPRLLILGATGSLGSHVLRLAIEEGYECSVLVRNTANLTQCDRSRITVYEKDISQLTIAGLAEIIQGHDVLINCAGNVTAEQVFVDLFDRIVGATESLDSAVRPVCWFLAGAALLNIGDSDRKGVDLPVVRSTYWPHKNNFERLSRSPLDWRLLCPGPMVEGESIGLEKLRVELDRLPVPISRLFQALPSPILLPIFAKLIPQMIVPYSDVAALMLANMDKENTMSCHRIGVALPVGMKGKKEKWSATSVKPA